ncbi:MAG: efflux RND transporter periplasmic adaptor subunit [Cyclobacteriaceae bacterium]
MNISNRTFIISLAITLAAGIFAGWIFFSDGESELNAPKIASESTVWTCSMHPQIRQNESGDCPICGMELIPVGSFDDQALNAEAVSMSPTAMQLANVRTAIVGEMDPIKELRLNGKVSEDERMVSSQSSHIPGRIERLLVNFTGEYVKQGQVIAYMYSPDLETAQEELLEAQKIKDRQPQLFQAAIEKLRNWKLTKYQIDRIMEQGAVISQFPITADISGYVLEKNVNVGDYVERGSSLFKIANLSQVWIVFDVYESELPWVQEGDLVQFTIQSLPGEQFSGEITFVDPVIDPQTRVAEARVEVSNPAYRLKPAMFASGVVEASLEYAKEAVVVPRSAVLWTGKRSVVYVKQASARNVSFELREVVLGPSLGDSYLIESGLEKGEEIAVSGTFSIDAAAQLAGKPSMMNPDMGSGSSADAVSEEARETLQSVYDAYLEFKNALTRDELEGALQASSNLMDQVNAVDPDVFDDLSRDAWEAYDRELLKALQMAGENASIEKARKMFQLVSNEMIAMTKRFRPYSDTLYIQYCPMADSNRGAYWLSTDEQIRNPYYGPSMLKCGEVAATIN